MKFINVVFTIFILIFIVGSGLAAKSGPIEMRTGANITLDGGKVLASPNGTAATDLWTVQQSWDKINKSGDTMQGVLNVVNGTGQAAASYAQLHAGATAVTVGFADTDYIVSGTAVDEIQAAVDHQYVHGGGDVILAPGNYSGFGSSEFILKRGVRLIGSGAWYSSNATSTHINAVTTFTVTGSTYPAIKVEGGMWTVQNIRAWYPNQVRTNVTMTVYPEFISDTNHYDATGFVIRYVNFGNAYAAVKFDASCGPGEIKDCTGFPRNGIYLDNAWDSITISDVHFHPLWMGLIDPDQSTVAGLPAVIGQIQRYGTAFKVLRNDGGSMTRCFGIYYHEGINITYPAGDMSLSQCMMDGTPHGFVLLGSTHVKLSQCLAYASTAYPTPQVFATDDCGFLIQGVAANGHIGYNSLTDCDVGRSGGDAFTILSSSHNVIQGGTATGWNQASATAYKSAVSVTPADWTAVANGIHNGIYRASNVTGTRGITSTAMYTQISGINVLECNNYSIYLGSGGYYNIVSGSTVISATVNSRDLSTGSDKSHNIGLTFS